MKKQDVRNNLGKLKKKEQMKKYMKKLYIKNI